MIGGYGFGVSWRWWARVARRRAVALGMAAGVAGAVVLACGTVAAALGAVVGALLPASVGW